MDAQGTSTDEGQLFCTGDLFFTVETNHEADRKLIDSLLCDLSTDETPPDKIAEYSLLRSGDGPAWASSGPRVTEHAPTAELSSVLGLLMAGLNISALDAQPEKLHLHAGAAVRDRATVVIAAERNTGKTTTITQLVCRGWEFLTDEMVALGDPSDGIVGYPKPLSIKPHGQHHVGHLLDRLIPPTGSAVAIRFVAASSAGATLGSPAPPRLIVLLKRDSFAAAYPPVRVRELHPVDAVVSLMQETLDAERYGDAAIRLAQLAVESRCVEIWAGSPDATVDAIEEAFARPSVDPLSVERMPPSLALKPSVVTVRIGDRAVVHDLDSGRIFALDAVGTRVWEQIAGWETHPDIDLAGPVVSTLVEELRALGVLADGHA